MRVEELIIDGFKSYSTRTVVSHWDPQFNAITGLNGSGKSNILDAICFVLGIASMATVRASNLQDLIYKRGQAGVTKASVTIVFNNSQKDRSPIGFENIAKISVTRQITLGGASKYLINGHRAQQQAVLQLFQSVQLNINNPNFLIMQGKITKVLNMKPKEILALIEEASGTRMFEDRRQKAEKTMLKKDVKLLEIKSILEEEVEPKLRRFEHDKDIYLQFQNIQMQMERLEQIVAAHDYTISNNELVKNTEIIDSNKKKKAAVKEALKEIENEIIDINTRLNQVTIKRDDILKKNEKTKKEYTEKLTALNSTSTRLKTSIQIQKKNLEKENKSCVDLKKGIKNKKVLFEEKSKALVSEASKEKILEADVRSLKEELENKKELLSSLQASGSSPTGYINQINRLKRELNDHNMNLKKDELKINSNNIEIENNNVQIKEFDNTVKLYEQTLKELENEQNEIQMQLRMENFDENKYKQLKENETNMQRESKKLSTQIESWKRKLYNLDFQYDHKNVNFEPQFIKGVAATLFDINQENMDKAQALQVCAGGKLFNIVVENDSVAADLLENGNLKKRVTIIPLNKISARTIKHDVIVKAKDISGYPHKVDLALNLIEFDNDVAKAMQFIFGSALICESADIAKKITFHPEIRTKSITLEGDVYDPEGTLSGGSRNNNSNILEQTQIFNKLLKEYKDLQNDLENCQRELKVLDISRSKFLPLINKNKMILNKTQQIKDEMKSSYFSVLTSRNIELRNDNDHIQTNIDKLESLIKITRGSIKSTEDDLRNFEQNKDGSLDKLKNEIKAITKTLSTKEQEYDAVSELVEELNIDKERLIEEISADQEELESLKLSIKETNSSISISEKNLLESQKEIDLLKQQSLDDNMENKIIEDEYAKLTDLVNTKMNEKNKMPALIKELQETIDECYESNRSLDEKLDQLVNEFEWLETDKPRVSKLLKDSEDIVLEQSKANLKKLKESHNSLKNRVNPNVITMIESVLKREKALRTMISTIEADKQKIQETIETLNQHKIDALMKTYEKVTVDFGDIFSELLPNSHAKLVILPNSNITDGLEVKVKLGSIWKESLVELSGGQRSLVALSLILALLQFKPAPMYILDEVDAALDLSHTQNIGHLIKTKFKGSQFIVVSLKEGMFTNANRVFRTRFQDGTSTVNIMT
ncbi:related to Structural maintenance of chromosomes protein 2 [Hanseniaspora guilliermondii]|uniref:Structural maintenance of chromosomes protein n=1 Tax=Hanseniaspora guilliermondii TaxID=56406 RepID=A0A1L0B3V0_9ASCO|nr:related to Structural maintenance of chromosomes protein 2 [Hanseniaspora guilliermondii]